MADSFATRAQLDVNGKSYTYSSLPKLGQRFDLAKLPWWGLDSERRFPKIVSTAKTNR